ncbi:MAG TPA: ATP-dependent zinc metalloprotease FtsH [Thermodesulfobacteriota bacterium]|nr:ATP-dependent zinc metalloprotease FtsH [Deltaproteobacteria bacterium]HNR12332.1 ATP-dependent zinc metalloprotease FtsH [Thermodesulfobacteriota bacterium]HNU71283.1 ATP-dependent zinc metalloprotease FtsH [Thermodesulfobacteriota bacterium]HQO77477.1 ATP-dependent zinc metalloprotease FtsH [Thermodesulfobacteriota bacterium]
MQKDNSSSNRLRMNMVRLWLWILIFFLFSMWLWDFSQRDFQQTTEISYSLFRTQLIDNNIREVTVRGDRIVGFVKEPVKQPNDPNNTISNFSTIIPSFGDSELMVLLTSRNVNVQTELNHGVTVWSMMLTFLPFMLILGMGWYMIMGMRRQGQNFFSMTSSKAHLYEKRKENITFNDVAGATGAKRELQEIVEYLKNPARFQYLGGAVPKGVLLVGPPGTGKTLLARAIAGEADVPFYSITGSDFMEMFVGIGASRVRNMFSDARKIAPSIIFIDELDSIGRTRGAGLTSGHDEREQTLNQLLSELDGFEPSESIIVLAATNRPDILDPALLRPGRFDRRITVEMPTLEDRLQILHIHARNKPFEESVDLKSLARGTPGFSGADLENLLNESALIAARKNKHSIGSEDIEEARDKVMLGLARENLALTEEETTLLAYHEGGHAIVAALLPHADPIHKVTIVPRSQSLGVTQQLPERDKYVYRKEYLLDRMAVMMGGRAAENLVFQTSTNGSESDLKVALTLARKMVLDWGMSEKFQNVAWGSRSDQIFLSDEISPHRQYSEATCREIDEEVKTVLELSYSRSVALLTENRSWLDRVAAILVEKEEITGTEVHELRESAIGTSHKHPGSLSSEKRAALVPQRIPFH